MSQETDIQNDPCLGLKCYNHQKELENSPEPFTNHHPDCPRYNESLIDVWKVTDGRSWIAFDKEDGAKEELEYCMVDEDAGAFWIVKEKMHKETYENLGEFEGW